MFVVLVVAFRGAGFICCREEFKRKEISIWFANFAVISYFNCICTLCLVHLCGEYICFRGE